ncbi:MAG: hypothetical protein L0241_01025 [Planctomycetia bacterium]|nr:hypothetical protein [Planctomycetia bacterium]
MKWFVCCTAAVALMVSAPAQAGDVTFKPIDTKKLVIQPSKTAANLAAGTINLIGQQAAGSIDNNGYVKTINNLFSIKKWFPTTQAGPSPLPSPNLYRSTQYKNYNTPVMPRVQVMPRR